MYTTLAHDATQAHVYYWGLSKSITLFEPVRPGMVCTDGLNTRDIDGLARVIQRSRQFMFRYPTSSANHLGFGPSTHNVVTSSLTTWCLMTQEIQ